MNDVNETENETEEYNELKTLLFKNRQVEFILTQLSGATSTILYDTDFYPRAYYNAYLTLLAFDIRDTKDQEQSQGLETVADFALLID